MPITCPIKFVPLSKSDFGKLDYSVMLPIRRNGEMLGEQRFSLTGTDSAFRLTAFEDQKKLPSYQRHLSSLLAISPLTAIHWINIALHRVTFFSIEAS